MDTYRSAARLGELLAQRGYRISTAESCTGGLLAGALTAVPGSSAWFEQGIVSYANEVKSRLLDVRSTTLRDHGAVSEAVVLEMAEGAGRSSGAEASIAVSGIAGPGGGSVDKPVGTVWIAWQLAPGSSEAERFRFDGDREAVRRQATQAALDGMLRRLDTP